MAVKHEWRKKEKYIYLPPNKPVLVDIPEFKYISINGTGNPNTDHFSACISALYSLSYAIKMQLKKRDVKPEEYQDYTVYPLEGIWSISEEAQKNFTGVINKNDFVYHLMIRQPDFVKENFFHEILDFTKRKKPHPLLRMAKFKKIKDGKCIQMTHLGSFDNEPESFQQMETFATKQRLKRISKIHREIYLSDFRKVPVEKLKTVLRFKVALV